MERNFYNEEFEHFLKQKSDQYKMYPSDKVWNNVYSSLHNSKRWYGLGIVLFFITGALFVSREVLLTNYNQVASNVNQDLHIVSPSTLSGHQKNSIRPVNKYISPTVQPVVFAATEEKITPQYLKEQPVIYSENEKNTVSSSGITGTESGSPVIVNSVTPSIPASAIYHIPLVFQHRQIITKQDEEKKTAKVDEENSQNTIIKNNYTGNIGLGKSSQWSIQVYASPIVSYRRLSNLSRSDKFVPVAINYAGNIDSYVHHKPGVGFEIGGKVQYKISSNLHLYAGAQLNYSRYYIDAFNYHTERATIALNSPVADTLANYTSIRNFNGYSPEQLQNQYLQVSVPIGAELKLLGNNRLQLSIAGSVQPTYLISSNSYLISSDYKNYIQNPDLARRFNVHTNLEAFVSYKLGGLKWQLGPQFRYQLLSSYSNQYPIREYLTEFGIKLGVTKSIW